MTNEIDHDSEQWEQAKKRVTDRRDYGSHLVAFVEELATIGRLFDPPVIEPVSAVPDGANVEFVVRRGPHSIAMRVFERGVGETRSCGTGAAAAAVAAAYEYGDVPADQPVTLAVGVPGGELQVTIRPDRRVDLTGPAVLVAEGTLRLPDG